MNVEIVDSYPSHSPTTAHEYTVHAKFLDRLSLVLGGGARVVMKPKGRDPICVDVPPIQSRTLSAVRGFLFGRRSFKVDHKKIPADQLPPALV